MILRMSFAGLITKADVKQIGEKTLVEVSLCKKHKGRNGGEDTFTWLRVNIWEPADFQLPKLVKGSFIAGSGDFQLRSYEKDGQKGASAECRCTSFDIEVSDTVTSETHKGTSAPQRVEPKANVQMTPVKPVWKAAIDGDEKTPF